MSSAYFGKYRGQVIKNDDPDKLGRIKVVVPSLFGDQETDWAMPCFPMASDKAGILSIPPVAAWVWVEFEQGDPNFPIWTGCFFDKQRSKLPDEVMMQPGSSVAVITPAGLAISLCDEKEKGIHLQFGQDGPKIDITDSAITLKMGNGFEIDLGKNEVVLKSSGIAKIELSSAKVAINNDALEVT